MRERLYRTQILLEPEQQRTLAAIASQEGRSISDVVREMIRLQLEQRKSDEDADLHNYLEGLERIRQHREAILKRRGGKPIGVETIPMDAPLCQAAFEWAGRLNQVRAYDGFYLALAEQLKAEFWTADKRLANAVQQIGANWVHWIGET